MLLNCGVGERLLRVLWTARRSNQSILKETGPEYSFGRTDAETETPILWPPDAKSWLIWKDPDAGKDWRREEKGTTGWDGWMASLAQWTWVWVGSERWWSTGRPVAVQSVGLQRVGHDWVTELTESQNVPLKMDQCNQAATSFSCFLLHAHHPSVPSSHCTPLPH